ncbi:hypothetical protein BDV38DRAFT_274573 [Aspergillus pseudotamarii]|uniref:DUF3074 domain-containing protein n=1 Tax=Aspergillus pseudotamarii TaxID=132259 RepID=A0A5N6SEI2_ASPPS|nr:uncharacterized protein BDV38DRAFT_274573 [Aspergillus pseudotamarii]KAE8133126.1 hypothetical protein BDV38DRAFT_274573 [Aspergillus pseudotamarii]
MKYISSVTRVERLLDWPREREIGDGWQEVDMSVNFITHTFHPKALISTHSFIVLVSCPCLPISRGTGFMSLQIPLTHEPRDLVPNLLCERNTALAPQNTVFASYASVEQVVVMSDRRSNVPKAIVTDVGLFIGWTAQRRSQCNQRAQIQTNATVHWET